MVVPCQTQWMTANISHISPSSLLLLSLLVVVNGITSRCKERPHEGIQSGMKGTVQ